MSDNNGWPGKPGVPLNPEQSGCHWVTHPADEQSGNGKMAVYWNGVGYWFLPGVAWKLEPVEMEKYKYHGPALTPAEVDARVSEARRVALFDAHQRALLYANTSHQHGHLLVDPHECAGQVAMEIAGSISAIDPDIRKAGYALRCKVLETAAQKAEMVIATGGPWPNIPAAIRALKGEGNE